MVAKSVSITAVIISGLLLALFAVGHATRTDSLMIITIPPVIVWLIGGICVSSFAFRFPKLLIGLIVCWLAAAFLLGDSPLNLFRGLGSSGHNNVQTTSNDPATPARPVRVITLNCLANVYAVRELKSLDPDIILTQESPSESALRELIESDFPNYSLLWSPDAAMLVRGEPVPHSVPAHVNSMYVLADVELADGRKFTIASLRLIPSPVRLDVWRPSAWREYTRNRQNRRTQLEKIYAAIQLSVDSERPMIVGGDFNAPAGDAIFKLLKPRLRDAWPEAGQGWGKTIVNQLPLHRIDQIWISDHFHPQSVWARASSHSDHRIVVCDVVLAEKN